MSYLTIFEPRNLHEKNCMPDCSIRTKVKQLVLAIVCVQAAHFGLYKEGKKRVESVVPFCQLNRNFSADKTRSQQACLGGRATLAQQPPKLPVLSRSPSPGSLTAQESFPTAVVSLLREEAPREAHPRFRDKQTPSPCIFHGCHTMDRNFGHLCAMAWNVCQLLLCTNTYVFFAPRHRLNGDFGWVRTPNCLSNPLLAVCLVTMASLTFRASDKTGCHI